MREITLEELLEAGCHFGHQVTRHNPKARDYIFEARDNIHIIDLAKTKEGLEEAGEFVRTIASQPGSSLIIVGNKRQARDLVKSEIKRAKEEGADGLYSVTNRWIGGILTNFSEVMKNFKKLKELTENLESEEVRSRYTKKEIGQWKKEKEKLESFYGGIFEMTETPSALFIIDTHLENLVVKEALKMGVPTVGITDTNADPYLIDHPIPANDDAVGSIKLITEYIVDAWIEGKTQAKNQESKNTNQGEETKEELKTKKEEKPKKPRKKKAETK